MADLRSVDVAKAWARKHGLHVFPVLRPEAVAGNDNVTGCPCQKGIECLAIGKHPAVKGWIEKATADPDGIEALFRNRAYNIGCVPGKSGHVVVDVDDEEGEAALHELWETVPATLSWRTGRDGGLHRLYKLPAGTPAISSRKLAPGLDVKSRGGFAALPPSLHKSGRTYTLDKTAPAYVYTLTPEEAAALTDHRDQVEPPPQEELRAPSFEELAAVVREIPNEETTTREQYIEVGYAIKAAAGPENEGEAAALFGEWTARWPGNEANPEGNDPEIVQRDWDGMLGPFRVGWDLLQAKAGIVAPEFDYVSDPTLPEEDGPRWVSLREALADPDVLKPPQPVSEWLAWRGRVSLFSAREKLGKSTLAATDVALSLKRGLRVCWITAEEALGEVVSRLAPLVTEEEWDQFHVLSSIPPKWVNLTDLVLERKPDVVYVDTLTNFVPLIQTPPDHSEKEAWAFLVMRFKRDWAVPLNAGVVLIAHNAKEGGEYHGSVGLGGSADMMIGMRGSADSTFRKLRYRGRFSVPEVGVRYDEEQKRYSVDVIADEALEQEAAVFRAIKGNPEASLRQVRDIAGLRHDTVVEIVDGLRASGFVRNEGTDARARLVVVPDVDIVDGRLVKQGDERLMDDWGAA